MRFRFLKPKFNRREEEIVKVCCETTLKSILKRQKEGKTQPIEDEVAVDLKKIIEKI